MQIVNYLILLLPYILILFVIYLIYNNITRKQNFKNTMIYVIGPILIMSIVLAVYYHPVNNILDVNNIEWINITVKHQNIEIRDKEKVKKIIEAINKYKFTKSARRSIMQEPYAGDYLIIISTYDNKKKARIQLLVLSDLITKNAPPTVEHGPGKNALIINEQNYNCNDNNGLSREIYNLINEFGVWDSKPL